MPQRRAERLGKVLARTLSKKGLDQELRIRALKGKWRRAVGVEIASHTRVVAFSRGVLQVEVDSSALLQELASMYREGISHSLASGDNPLAVREIRFRLPG